MKERKWRSKSRDKQVKDEEKQSLALMKDAEEKARRRFQVARCVGGKDRDRQRGGASQT